MSAAPARKLPPVPRAGRVRNGLHMAAARGSIEVTVAILSQGSIGIINERGDGGYTPLMVGAASGHLPIVRILVNKGANVSLAGYDSFTGLHLSAREGHHDVTKMLLEAGADLEAVTSTGATPLYSAALFGYSEVVRVLIAAGANPDSRMPSGETPLHVAALVGHLQAVKELLRGNANPLLVKKEVLPSQGVSYSVPLDLAAGKGNSEVVRELIRQVGIEGCGGSTGGENSLQMAAMFRHVDIMVILMDAGVVVTGPVLVSAAASGHERLLKLLLLREATGDVSVNSRGFAGQTPLLASVVCCSPRVARVLIDAGADTTSAVGLTNPTGEVMLNDTPLAFTSHTRREMVFENDATDEKLHGLEAIRRLLLQVDAVYAVSWLWADDTPAMVHGVKGSSGPRQLHPR